MDASMATLLGPPLGMLEVSEQPTTTPDTANVVETKKAATLSIEDGSSYHNCCLGAASREGRELLG